MHTRLAAQMHYLVHAVSALFLAKKGLNKGTLTFCFTILDGVLSRGESSAWRVYFALALDLGLRLRWLTTLRGHVDHCPG